MFTRFLAPYRSFELYLRGSNLLKDLYLLATRLFIARFFFSSGLTKIDDFQKTIALFTDEYKLPLIPPNIAAVMGTTAELSLPVLLVLGLGTRFAGLGFFIMTLVINIFVYPGVAENYYIMLLCFSLIAFGSGRWSLDSLICKE